MALDPSEGMKPLLLVRKWFWVNSGYFCYWWICNLICSNRCLCLRFCWWFRRANRAASLVVVKWLTHLPFNQMQLRVQPQLHQGIDLKKKKILQGLNLEEMQASETVVQLLYLDLLLWVRLFRRGRFSRLFSCGQFCESCCSRSS